jgi:DNA-binding transcriptional LysR family regulator
MVVVAAPGPEADLGSVNWLLREAGSGTRDATLALLQRLQIEPPLLTLGSVGAVVSSAALGLGVTLVSTDAVEAHLRAGTLRRIPAPGTPLSRPWHAVTTAAPTATTELFLRHLTDARHAGEFVFRVARSHPPTRPRG